MNHLTLRGTHREMGFQWGARLAERGLRLLDHVPFPLEAERRAFAAACHRRMRAISPPPWRSWRGWRRGRTAGRRTWRRASSPPTPCRPPAAVPAWRCLTGIGVFFGSEQRLSDGAGAGLHPCDIRIFRQGDPLYREHHLVRADGGRRQRPGTGHRAHLCLHA